MREYHSPRTRCMVGVNEKTDEKRVKNNHSRKLSSLAFPELHQPLHRVRDRKTGLGHDLPRLFGYLR